MKKIEDIKTPINLEEFRQGLKKYCLGYNDSIFIFNKTNNIKFNVDIDNISKMSDIYRLIQNEGNLDNVSSNFNLVLMCDISHIRIKNLIINKENLFSELKDVYLFNNQDMEERNNFLNSTPIAIEKIVAGEKVINEIDAQPYQTALDDEIIGSLYNHLFGEYFNTINLRKKKLIY